MWSGHRAQLPTFRFPSISTSSSPASYYILMVDVLRIFQDIATRIHHHG